MKNRNSLKFFTLFLAFVFVVCLIPYVHAIDAIGTIDADITVEQLTADSQILKYVDASVFASNNHVRRLEDEETLSSYVF